MTQRKFDKNVHIVSREFHKFKKLEKKKTKTKQNEEEEISESLVVVKAGLKVFFSLEESYTGLDLLDEPSQQHSCVAHHTGSQGS